MSHNWRFKPMFLIPLLLMFAIIAAACGDDAPPTPDPTAMMEGRRKPSRQQLPMSRLLPQPDPPNRKRKLLSPLPPPSPHRRRGLLRFPADKGAS
ncbi:MAG: hypothetical protein J4F46_11140 [Dehalococcoidia bacterium]|nr:hypothetical protein [Dehalococcoidia bacterium]